jgi:hypothetical protein
VYARVTTFEGDPQRIEEGIRLFRDEVIPWLRDSTGFRGWIVLLDRGNRRARGISFWETEEAMQADEKSGGALRDEVAENLELPMTDLEFYEVAAIEALTLDD